MLCNEHKQEYLKSYAFCLICSLIFFLLFGFNSPLYDFNPQSDYQWFITMGRSLLAGKIPYRDLFEQKGPIVYFVTAFACLFPNPSFIILLIETICMSLFCFICYRICIKRLNKLKTYISILIMLAIIFLWPNHMYSSTTVEEFSLPIYAYFLLCWLEFLFEHQNWNQKRALCLGICFGIILWSKYTSFYFMIIPLVIWFVISILHHNYFNLVFNIAAILTGILIITLPIIIFFAVNNALGDLFHIYYFVNLTAYKSTTSAVSNVFMYLHFNPLILFFTGLGMIRYTFSYLNQHGYLIGIAFIANFILITLLNSFGLHYYIQLTPYAVFGIIDWLNLFKFNIKLPYLKYLILFISTIICITICIPYNLYFKQNIKHNVPLTVAQVIHDYEQQNQIKATLFCYKTADFGFYNTLGIIPDTYYYANNYLNEVSYPEMYSAFTETIIAQNHNFIITEVSTWLKEQEFLANYYQPYTINTENCVYHFKHMFNYDYIDVDLILLIKI